jgi:hypothetical protein
MLCRSVGSESMSHSGLLDGEGPRPVIAVPQPARADADVHDVVIMGAVHAVRVLGGVRLQTAIVVGARRNVGDPLALHRYLVVPADHQRYLSKGGQVAVLPRTSTRVEDQLATPSRRDSNQRRLRCALSPAGSYDCQAAFTDKVDALLLIHSATLQQQPMRRTQGTACGITVSDAQEGIRAE